MARSKAWLWVPALMVTALVGSGLYLTILFDVEEYIDTHENAWWNGESIEGITDAEIVALADRFHRGEKPCAAHATAASYPSDGEYDNAVSAMKDAGLLNEWKPLTPVFWLWGDEREREQHGRRSEGEVLAVYRHNASWLDTVRLRLNRDELHRVAIARAGEREARLRERAKAHLETLSKSRIEQIRAVWEKHSRALSFPWFGRAVSYLEKALSTQSP